MTSDQKHPTVLLPYGGQYFSFVKLEAYEELLVNCKEGWDLHAVQLHKYNEPQQKLVDELRKERDELSKEVIELRFKKDPEVIAGVKDLSIAHIRQVLERVRSSRDEIREERDEWKRRHTHLAAGCDVSMKRIACLERALAFAKTALEPSYEGVSLKEIERLERGE